MNGILLSLRKRNKLHSRTYENLRCTSGSTPFIYGLPKIYKYNIPLRPIVLFYSSPTYNLSKYLVSLLSPLVGGTSSAVLNSKDFADFIQQQSLNESDILVSFDVISLFTKVLVSLALEIARRRLELYSTLSDRTNFAVEDALQLLSLCLNATFFTIAKVLVQQWDLRCLSSLRIWLWSMWRSRHCHPFHRECSSGNVMSTTFVVH